MKSQVIIALDYPTSKDALELVDKVGIKGSYYKVGLELFISEGHIILPALKERGKSIFLDLKIHDIPNTASQAIYSCLKYGIDMVNIHVQGGVEMMKSCVNIINKHSKPNERPLLIGVTLLTSLDTTHLMEYNISSTPEEYVVKLARLAKDAGLDGVVSSARETVAIKNSIGKEFITVTPGIRPLDSALGDQKRVVTPQEAQSMGTDYMVIGRPITGNIDPKEALGKILKSLETNMIIDK